MKIKIKIHGHHFFQKIEGEALAWLQGISKGQYGNIIQVPCVIVKDKNKVHLVNLQEELSWSEIEVIE